MNPGEKPMRSLMTSLVYITAIGVAMAGWLWVLFGGLVWTIA
jgi:hypothetical protein